MQGISVKWLVSEMNKIMAFDNEQFIYAQVSSTPFSAFLMGNKSSVGMGGGTAT